MTPSGSGIQELRLSAPDESSTIALVQKQTQGLAQRHGVVIAPEVVVKAVQLTNQYLPTRRQPDKSVQLLHSACVQARGAGQRVLSLKELQTTLATLTGKPVALLGGTVHARLGSLAEHLKAQIIGQDHMITKVVALLSQRLQGLGEPGRNLATFMFAGDSGVAKTASARAIAEGLFGSGEHLLHLDLAEYHHPASVHKLIGAPAGLVGSENQGVLPAWLSQYASGVILLDEMEKAHLQVQQFFLGLLDRGQVRSAKGMLWHTNECVIVMTTNVITKALLQKGRMGFSSSSAAHQDLVRLLAEHFSTELLARIDEIIVFKALGPQEWQEIMQLRLQAALQRLEQRKIRLRFDGQRLCAYLVQQLQQTWKNARGIERVLENYLLQPIALCLMHCAPGQRVVIALDEQFYETGKPTLIYP